MRYVATVSAHSFEQSFKFEHSFEIDVRETNVREQGGTLSVRVDGQPLVVDALCVDGRAVYSLLVEGRSYELVVERRGDAVRVSLGGETFEVRLADPLTVRSARHAGPDRAEVRAPMPGVIVAVPAEVGRHVRPGEPVVILEAMKMETALTAPIEGIVTAIKVEPRQTVAAGASLLVVERAPSGSSSSQEHEG